MCLKFAKNGIKNKTLNYLFPINEKMHQMKTRENNKLKVNFANTDRLKNSSIISMQNMLNEDSIYKWDKLTWNLCIGELWLSVSYRLYNPHRCNKPYHILSIICNDEFGKACKEFQDENGNIQKCQDFVYMGYQNSYLPPRLIGWHNSAYQYVTSSHLFLYAMLDSVSSVTYTIKQVIISTY